MTPELEPSASDHQGNDADPDATAIVALAETAEKLAYELANLDSATSLHLQQGLESGAAMARIISKPCSASCDES